MHLEKSTQIYAHIHRLKVSSSQTVKLFRSVQVRLLNYLLENLSPIQYCLVKCNNMQ